MTLAYNRQISRKKKIIEQTHRVLHRMILNCLRVLISSQQWDWFEELPGIRFCHRQCLKGGRGENVSICSTTNSETALIV